MPTLTLSDIIKLKELLIPYGLTLRTHDACGGQSFSLEPEVEPIDDKAFAEIDAFFASNNLTVRYFGEGKKDFIVK